MQLSVPVEMVPKLEFQFFSNCNSEVTLYRYVVICHCEKWPEVASPRAKVLVCIRNVLAMSRAARTRFFRGEVEGVSRLVSAAISLITLTTSPISALFQPFLLPRGVLLFEPRVAKRPFLGELKVNRSSLQPLG